jgi:hypothetical protein
LANLPPRLSRGFSGRGRTLEQQAVDFAEWAAEFNEQFRHMDISLTVERVEKPFCSGCGCEWETMVSPYTDDWVIVCAGCGMEVTP